MPSTTARCRPGCSELRLPNVNSVRELCKWLGRDEVLALDRMGYDNPLVGSIAEAVGVAKKVVIESLPSNFCGSENPLHMCLCNGFPLGGYHVLGPHGRDSTLRQWSLHLASRGGKHSRNRAIVAVARKLAVLLHCIWVTQEPYIPFYAVAA
jgi:hypothetical protein